jgi:hypothetical protein
MSSARGNHRAIDQNFRLEGEARFNEQSSAFLEFRLFDKQDESYLGDNPRPGTCYKKEPGQQGEDYENCEGEHQNISDPGYEPFQVHVTKAYARYAFDYCILEAGRRGRDWGLGIFLDSGNDPFDTAQSRFDGITCEVNIQKSQILGFSVGYDKLSETGTYVLPRPANDNRRFGAATVSDDLDQFFFTIEYNDRKANAGSAFTKQIGIYFASITGADFSRGGSETDVKFLDLYTGFYINDLAFRNELLIRSGRSGDPNFVLYGGGYDPNCSLDADCSPRRNRVDSLGLAGSIEWTLAQSGAYIGPSDFQEGNAVRHIITADYVYAPGDSNGYYSHLSDDQLSGNPNLVDAKQNVRQASALAFHKNFKPALIFFNGRAAERELHVNGVFDPQRVMNVTLFGLSYRYENIQKINFEAKLISGFLNQSIPSDLKSYYLAQDAAGTSSDKPIGFFGSGLGYELDLMVWDSIKKEVDYGFAVAYALPGQAWKTNNDKEPAGNFLLQTFVSFNF